MQFKNWKLLEIQDNIIHIEYDAYQFKKALFKKLNILENNQFNYLDRRETEISWRSMDQYFNFNFDNSILDDKLELMFKKSELKTTNEVLVFYNHENIAIEINTNLLISEWEDFFQSTKFNTIIINRKHHLIMEVSRDYILHSNFKIWNDDIYCTATSTNKI
ncbi:MAG: hypothetical protein IPQ10_09835 [Saprospiraceae bacterium]|jgi:hypothetical protein|nr:hypothetical protein [Saprospiraceae bacterium]MBK8153292.1 hypothetical protein [Saprospiraceae bacterium]MBL0261342.1 hypothetical protein [Saprospiraceae bacterium]